MVKLSKASKYQSFSLAVPLMGPVIARKALY